jgi:hypothetical protein
MGDEDVEMVGEALPPEEERKIAPEMEMSRWVISYSLASVPTEKDTLKRSILEAIEKQGVCVYS